MRSAPLPAYGLLLRPAAVRCGRQRRRALVNPVLALTCSGSAATPPRLTHRHARWPATVPGAPPAPTIRSLCKPASSSYQHQGADLHLLEGSLRVPRELQDQHRLRQAPRPAHQVLVERDLLGIVQALHRAGHQPAAGPVHAAGREGAARSSCRKASSIRRAPSPPCRTRASTPTSSQVYVNYNDGQAQSFAATAELTHSFAHVAAAAFVYLHPGV